METLDLIEEFEKSHEAELAEWQAKHKRVRVVELDDQVYVLCNADLDTLEKFLTDASKEKDKVLAMSHFVAGALLYPSKQEWFKIFRQDPGIAVSLSNEVSELSNMQAKARRKK